MAPVETTLFLSDGGALGTADAANPTLTIIAVALLQAEYMSQQMTFNRTFDEPFTNVRRTFMRLED